MDIFEEIVELRRAGRRGALATIVNARGSIPSFASAKMLVRDDGTISGTIGGGCVEAEVWQAAREVMEERALEALVVAKSQHREQQRGGTEGERERVALRQLEQADRAEGDRLQREESGRDGALGSGRWRHSRCEPRARDRLR